MLKVEQIERIRRKYYIEKKSMRQIAKELGHGRETVRRAIDQAEPGGSKPRQKRTAPKIGPHQERIDELVKENEHLPRKQRYTWQGIYKIIKGEGYSGSGSTLRHYLAEIGWKKKKVAVYMPLEFDPGTDAQVDWGEAAVLMGREQIRVQLFVMWLCYSRRLFVMAFPSQKQEAFFQGHIEAFQFFEGVPQRLTYDNLKIAVYRVLQGKNRQEQEQFVEFRSHYLFESNYCTPGMGHQKGGVEHNVGYARRNFLVPLPAVESFAELNEYLLAQCLENDQRQVSGQPQTIGAAWQQEVAQLQPLPAQAYPCCHSIAVRLNPYSQVTIETNRYSVPTDLAQPDLVAKVYPFEVQIFRPNETEPIARHQRCYERKQEVIDPLHYLPLLQQRPGALQHAKPIRAWRSSWPPIYEDLLSKLQAQGPEGDGVRQFIQILQLHHDYPVELIEAAIEQALRYGCVHADGVKLCLHQLAQPDPELPPLSLDQRPHLAAIGQQEANLSRYDQLRGGL